MKISENQKCIFITGAASGMGLETARLFAEGGWFVGGYDLNQDGLNKLQQELGEQACSVAILDVTDGNSYQRAVDAFAHDTNGRMDILFNNAGIGTPGFFDEQEFEDILAVVDVNFIGVMRGVHLATPLLRKTPDSLCFSTCSSSATFSLPGLATYSATKHAVRGLTEALSIEMSRYGVRVADVLPGVIDTPLLPDEVRNGSPKEGMFRVVPPSEVAKVVWASYHDNPEKLHWFVPEEIQELDQASVLDPEGTRKLLADESPIMSGSELK